MARRRAPITAIGGHEDAHRAHEELALQVAHDDERGAAEDEGGADPARHRDQVTDLADAPRRQAGEQQRDERDAEDHGVDGGAALAGPVDVLEVQDEGELVEREGGAGAEDEGEELDPRAARLQGELQDAGDDHADDAEHGVVDVQPTRA